MGLAEQDTQFPGVYTHKNPHEAFCSPVGIRVTIYYII